MRVVIDSSIALSWCFEDEATSGTLFERVRPEGVVVRNVLLQAERRGPFGTGDDATRPDLIEQLPMSIDQETTART